MMLQFPPSKSDVITAALLGKYGDWKIEKLTGFVRGVAQERSKKCQSYKIDPDIDLENLVSDILRQLKIFDLIDSIWLENPINLNLVLEINSMANGLKLEENRFRDFEFVPDFGGDALTESKNIKSELNNLENLLQEINSLSSYDKAVHAELMARIFFEIVRIHPFPDGNGRTARFLVELMARKWGYHYIIIPKYRNDVEWRDALDKSAKGDNSAIETYFLERLIKMQ